MIPSKIIELALANTNMTLVELGDGVLATGEERAYDYLNMVKDPLWSKIVSSSTGKDLSWEEWTKDFTALQTEYALPQVVLDENRLKKIQSLGIAYTNDAYDTTGTLKYIPATLVDRATLPNDWDWYVNNQSKSEPIYCVSDKSIFVAPVSTATIANGLKLTGVKKIPDYDENTSELDMVIPDDYHYLLVEGLEALFLHKQGSKNMAWSQKQAFNQSTQEALRTEKDTHIGPMFMKFPDNTPNTRIL